MAVKIPADFDISMQNLDPLESFIRDKLRLNILGWAKFRHTIHVGNKVANLVPKEGPVPSTVQDAYRELAKSHYEVVTSLGSARLSLDLAQQSPNTNPLLFKKSFKDFYFHLGCIFDNLARLIYIVNDPQSDSALYQKGSLKGKIIRHWIDWGRLPGYRGYSRLKRSRILREIVNIRNAFTHGWTCPIMVNTATGTPYWPRAIREKRDYYWPYDELALMKQRYRRGAPIVEMMTLDLAFVEQFQDRIFIKLTRDIRKFETRYGVVIR